MDNYKNLAIPAEIYDEMGIDEDTPLQFDYDADSQTLRVHVLTEEELETLAGHCEDRCEDCCDNRCADRCEDCAWAESCDEAHGDPAGCPDFVEREGDDW